MSEFKQIYSLSLKCMFINVLHINTNNKNKISNNYMLIQVVK